MIRKLKKPLNLKQNLKDLFIPLNLFAVKNKKHYQKMRKNKLKKKSMNILNGLMKTKK